MKITISLGSKQLILEPETEFEREIMKKYFQEDSILAKKDNEGCLWINFSGAARGSVNNHALLKDLDSQ